VSHHHDPVQLLLFEQETVSVKWVSKRFHTSEQTVRRLIEENHLKGYRLTPHGWWNIYRASVDAYEAQLQSRYGGVLRPVIDSNAVQNQRDKGRKKP
jgi:DeoR/GlpR family transcriptional regulator of sugar metabolism